MASTTTYQLMVKLGATTSPSWKTTLGKAEDALSGLNSLSNKIIAGIAAGVTAAAATATIAISNAVETYRSFETEMATVQSISGASVQQFLKMKEAAMDAGQSTVFTATEAASALEYMSLAGWSVDDSIAGLTPMLRLAAATGKELQTTSDLVTDSMSALELEVKDLDMYLDKLVEGNNDSNTTAEELMQALVKTGGASRTLGASLDDTITSLGVLADNGLKGTEAGTALNAILVRLAGNTTALKELGKLEVDLWNDDETFVGLEKGLTRINNALSELSDKQRTMSLKNIAGTHYYSQLAYLLDAVKEVTDENGDASTAWKDLETQVANSTGALSNMYDITTDTLLFAQKRLASAKEDMQLRIVDVFSDDAKDFLLWLSEKMPKATDSIVGFAEAHQGEFADMLENAGEWIELLWENGVAAGQWIIQHKSTIVGGLKGIAAGIITVKTAVAAVKIAEFFTNPLSALLGVTGLAVTAIGAVAGAIRDANAAAVESSLAEHFGSISLSMKELETVAQYIVGSDSLTGVLSVLEEFDELEAISDRMDDTVRTLEKLNWKVSIGMELTEGEKEDYQKAIDSFVENAQAYALQAQYSVSVSMQMNLSEDDLERSNIVSKVNQFYSDKYQELVALGTDLNKAVTDAFNDGFLEIEEADAIANLQAQMADIERELAVGEFDAQLSLLGQKYSGIDLTAESFQELMEAANNSAEDLFEANEQKYRKDYSSLTAAYKGGALTEDEYNTEKQNLADDLANNNAEVDMNIRRFLLNTVYESYGDAISQSQEAIDSALAEMSDPMYAGDWGNSPVQAMDSLIQRIFSAGPARSDKQALDQLLEMISDLSDNLDRYVGDLDRLDPERRDELLGMLEDIETMQRATAREGDGLFRGGTDGNTEALYRYIVNYINNSDADENAKSWINEHYGELTGYPASIISGFAETNIRPAVEEIYDLSQGVIDEYYRQGFEATATVDILLDPQLHYETMADNIVPDIAITGGMVNRISGLLPEIMQNAEGGIYNTPILTTFAEKGPEAAVPLDGSDRAKSIWMRAGEILGLIPQGNRDQSILAGVSGGTQERNVEKSIQIYFNPPITIQGNASKEDVQEALSWCVEEMREMIVDVMDEVQRERDRRSFSN